MIAIAGTPVPAARRGPMIVSAAVAIVATAVTAAAVPDRANREVVVTAVIARAKAVTVARIVEATARLDDGGRFGAVIRISAPGAATDVAGVVVTTSKRQDGRGSQKQGIRTTHRDSLMRRTAMDDFDTAPTQLNAR
jgi:hypothetical protein